MRESMGAAAFVQILMIFIVIFVSFLAVSVNFATAFRVKNKVISYIEANEGLDDQVRSDIDEYLQDTIGYTPDKVEITENEITGIGVYYTVATTMDIDLPIIGALINNFEITGETKVIYNRE